jgi:HD-GYP domain-containing protein (c-di-GMP phosphodiesterase class II)
VNTQPSTTPHAGAHVDAASQYFANFRTLHERMRSAGIVLVGCGSGGELISRPAPGEDWLADLFCGSPMVRSCLRNAVAQWNQEEAPSILKAMPGLWLAPTPVTNRRRRVGYSVAAIPTGQLLEAEQLQAMCQSVRMDATLCKRMLTELEPSTDGDVARLASLVRFAHEDHLQISSKGQAVESVGKQLAESYEEMNLLYTIIQSMTVQERPERFVALACQELLTTLSYSWVGTQLADDRDRLKSLSGRLVFAGQTGHSAAELRQVARNLLKRAQPDEPIVLEPGRRAEDAEFAPLGKLVLAQPVCSNGEVIGILIAGDKCGPDNSASSVDMKLLGATATHMSIFLENAALYDDLNAMFLGTLEALTASIDAKDRYTCGHSRRVAHLTAQLARAIGLDDNTVARCHIAGLVHDVGKIGVPEAVLLKPGKLNADEFAWIRKHPEIGYRILKDIPQLNDILPGVLHHHERWDGQGYPQGLAGEGIPLVARLISLADSFDAMSSTRTYRSALSRRQVLSEIGKCNGSQFDPALGSAFLDLDFSEFDRLVAAHRADELADRKERAA